MLVFINAQIACSRIWPLLVLRIMSFSEQENLLLLSYMKPVALKIKNASFFIFNGWQVGEGNLSESLFVMHGYYKQ